MKPACPGEAAYDSLTPTQTFNIVNNIVYNAMSRALEKYENFGRATYIKN